MMNYPRPSWTTFEPDYAIELLLHAVDAVFLALHSRDGTHCLARDPDEHVEQHQRGQKDINVEEYEEPESAPMHGVVLQGPGDEPELIE